MSTLTLADDIDTPARLRRKRPARTVERREAIRESAGILRRRTHPKGR